MAVWTPKTTYPTYPDFLYFSYVIGTSAQTADVSITSRPMRILNILHILLAYGFNTTILAICINVNRIYSALALKNKTSAKIWFSKIKKESALSFSSD